MLGDDRLVEFEAQAGRVGQRRTRPGAAGSSRGPGSLRQGTSNSPKASWIMKLGVLTGRSAGRRPARPGRSSSAARRAGPAPRPARRSSCSTSMPPQWAMSICTTSAARRRSQPARNRPACTAARRPRSGRPTLLLHLGQQVQALGRDRLLAPGRLEAVPAAGSSRRAIPADSRPWNSIISPTCGPDRLAHRRDDRLDRQCSLLRGQVFPGRAERIELQRPVARARPPRGRARRNSCGVVAPPYQPLA